MYQLRHIVGDYDFILTKGSISLPFKNLAVTISNQVNTFPCSEEKFQWLVVILFG
jgi:hypothetical protein